MASKAAKRWVGYLFINGLFVFLVAVLAVLGRSDAHDPAAYLILLVLILSSTVLFAKSSRGPYIVLLVASPMFFIMFGLGDLLRYVLDVPGAMEARREMLTSGEVAILLAFLSLYFGYWVAVATLSRFEKRWFVYDWGETTTFIVGLLCFVAGIVATFVFQVEYSTVRVGKPTLGPIALNAVILGRMLGQLGEVLLAYSSVTGKRRIITVVVVGLIVLKLPLAIILNAKFIGVSFIGVYVVVAWLYLGKVPRKVLMASVMAVLILFPLAYQYRAYMGTHHVSVADTLSDVVGHLSKGLGKKVEQQKKAGALDTLEQGLVSFATRANLKPIPEMIVARTGVDRPYQAGRTLAPLPYVLIPRLIWPEKPAVSVGRLFNQEFQISEDPDTYISTSFLGELYWNYSWQGMVLGMIIIGFTFGSVGALANLQSARTVTRVLLIALTIYALVFKFQTGIAQQYSIFIRAFLILAAFHFLFRNKRLRRMP